MRVVTKKGKIKSSQRGAPDEKMAALEAAAQAKDDQAFWRAYQAITWTDRPASDFVHAVNLALMAGAYITARNLAQEGHELHPDHAELEKMAYVLAPPQARVVKSENQAGRKANHQWLKEHRSEYRGQWVALRDGELLGAAASPADLEAQVGEIRDKEILLTIV
ncbi:MAG: hypothetical protein L0332_06085 [Chloroflexi bacterium]|nr:hypothetical protein [Chloroflexota bacterium]MCI0575516.1 hypothetical protein [Chloroflexota bacterium]MCI0644293.1 hypothetical protein [Chloroflexota bacterium]MCI0726276.1 hypothetical protein [Chloroflexota bacterium]